MPILTKKSCYSLPPPPKKKIGVYAHACMKHEGVKQTKLFLE